MDDLDRLYYEFVEVLRRERPIALREPITVAEVHHEVIPYRRVRDSIGFRSHDDYEVVFSRLLSGERGYVESDPVMQGELKAGLDESLPDIRRFLAFPDVKISLNPEKIPPPGDIRYAPPELREATDWVSEAIESAEQAAEQSDSSPETGAEEAAGAAEPAAPLPFCPQCREAVPEGAAFCPFCARRLLPDVCQACGADLDPAWSFCARCGAGRED
jgi:hypothetical protein